MKAAGSDLCDEVVYLPEALKWLLFCWTEVGNFDKVFGFVTMPALIQSTLSVSSPLLPGSAFTTGTGYLLGQIVVHLIREAAGRTFPCFRATSGAG
jgi:hypothetical protein